MPSTGGMRSVGRSGIGALRPASGVSSAIIGPEFAARPDRSVGPRSISAATSGVIAMRRASATPARSASLYAPRGAKGRAATQFGRKTDRHDALSTAGSATGVHSTCSMRDAPVSQHHQPSKAERDAAGRRHLAERGEEILVDRIALAMHALLLGHLGSRSGGAARPDR
jgi:hypothetical protein